MANVLQVIGLNTVTPQLEAGQTSNLDTYSMVSPLTIDPSGTAGYSGTNALTVTGNVSANALYQGTTNQAATTSIQLTASSVTSWIITGSGGQTIILPDATTLPVGAMFTFNNNQSSGAITVNVFGSGSAPATVQSGGYATVTLLTKSVAAGTWDVHYGTPSNVTWSTNTFNYPGTITGATWNGVAVPVLYGGTGTTTATGTAGSVVLSNTPTLVTPVLGAASGTSLALSSATGLTLNGSVLSKTNTLLFSYTGSAQTYTMSAGCVAVAIMAVGGGGGGGFGGTYATTGSGGAAGGGAGTFYGVFRASDISSGSPFTVTVGQGGAGGTSGSTTGTKGGITSVGSIAYGGGAGGGGPGSSGATSGGGAGATPANIQSGSGTTSGGTGTFAPNGGSGVGGGYTTTPWWGGSGGGCSAVGVAGSGGGNGTGTSGGGAGGGLNATVGQTSGGGGGSIVNFSATFPASAAAGANGTAGTANTIATLPIFQSSGGSGGGGGVNGGTGGAGGLGSGGGGGGAGTTAGGNGGAGGNGLVLIVEYF